MPSLCIPELIEAVARKTPDAISVASPGRKPLRYGRLVEQISYTGKALNDLGLGRNDRIAIAMPNAPETAVAFLAVASSATSVPLNPAYKESDFQFSLSDMRVRAIVVPEGSDSPAIAAAKSLGVGILTLSPKAGAEAGIFTIAGDSLRREEPHGKVQPDDVAMALHTSGTTSRPKIVPISHANICLSAGNTRDAIRLSAEDRCINVMPLFHSHGLVGTLLSSIISGATVVVPSGFEARAFFGWMEEFRPTWYTAVPTIHQAILDMAAACRSTISKCPLRLVRSSSAPLQSHTRAGLRATFGVPVIDTYGMTEASGQITSMPLADDERKAGSVGIGAGAQVAIMDEKGTLLGPGEAGEIVIKGDSVVKGYENNPAANANAFTNGWFRTGDQGCMDEEHFLYLKGRIKEIVNRGGNKISPLEIDEVLAGHPAVGQAATFAVPHATLGEDVAAAVVLREKGGASEKELRDFAFTHLADYKVPSRILVVEEIPKGPTGKLQRRALAEKLSDRLKIPYIAPRNPAQELLADIWAETLGCDRIGINDNFFMLGGDSLKATHVVSRIGELFGVELPIEEIFRSPNLWELAVAVSDRAADFGDRESIGRILDELEGLTDEESMALLGGDLRGKRTR